MDILNKLKESNKNSKEKLSDFKKFDTFLNNFANIDMENIKEFQNSDVIINKIKSCEEKNLILIKLNQESEGDLLEIKKKMELLKTSLKYEKKNLLVKKDNLVRKIKKEDSIHKNLIFKNKTNDKISNLNKFEKIRTKLINIYNLFRKDCKKQNILTKKNFTDNSIKMKNLIKILLEIENLFYFYKKKLCLINPQNLYKEKYKLENSRRKLIQSKKIENAKNFQREQIQKKLMKLDHPLFVYRKDFYRSPKIVFKKKTLKKKETVKNESNLFFI